LKAANQNTNYTDFKLQTDLQESKPLPKVDLELKTTQSKDSHKKIANLPPLYQKTSPKMETPKKQVVTKWNELLDK